jgi:hypothetical protein
VSSLHRSPPVEERLWGMDPLGGWTTARRCPRTPDRGSRHLASSRPQASGGPESFSGIETAHLGSGHSRQYSGAFRAGMALARRPPLLPHPPPNLLAPTRELFFRGIQAGWTLLGGAKPAQEASLLPSGTIPHQTGHTPGHGPLCQGMSVPPPPNN